MNYHKNPNPLFCHASVHHQLTTMRSEWVQCSFRPKDGNLCLVHAKALQSENNPPAPKIYSLEWYQLQYMNDTSKLEALIKKWKQRQLDSIGGSAKHNCALIIKDLEDFKNGN